MSTEPPGKQPPMKNRVVRVDDATWDRAQRRADERGEVLAETIRRFLRRYGR